MRGLLISLGRHYINTPFIKEVPSRQVWPWEELRYPTELAPGFGATLNLSLANISAQNSLRHRQNDGGKAPKAGKAHKAKK